jgi:hypothetical protein
VAVFLTRFSWFGRLFHDIGRAAFAGYHGVPIGAFEVTVLIRDALLLTAIVMWATREPLPEGRRLSLLRLERRRPMVEQSA